MQRHVEPGSGLKVVERVADFLDRFVRPVVGRSENGHHADRVLVTEPNRLVCGEVEPVSLHRDEPHLDVPVISELLPADLHVDAHHEVGLVGGFHRRPPAMLPASLEGQPTEHGRFARPRRRAAHRLVRVRCIPEPAQDVDAAQLQLCGLRVLILVDHVLVEALGHESLGLRFHPRADERRQVEAGVPVQHQIVMNDLVGDVGWQLVGSKRFRGDAFGLNVKEGGGAQFPVRGLRSLGMLQGPSGTAPRVDVRGACLGSVLT